ncbi:FitA-like ribbon-helix-helix domain-containing protein, partial [Crenothrix polyspora]|uniref:FitA-like ribbon-helix-helix domain-containing protein n=1 Tax=Crenothrix polyspora TaxID=360316 RepID=UPI003AF39C0D
MSSLVVRNLDQSIINALKKRAVEHQRSTEAEHRAILAEVLLKPARKTFARHSAPPYPEFAYNLTYRFPS